MDDVYTAEPNGLTMCSTFSGCGGTCTGYRLSGWRVPYASEFIPIARETYLANYPETFVDDRDVRKVVGADLLAAAGTDDLDLLEGSPPCSSFSAAGKRDAGWGQEKHYSEGVKQRTDDLFDEFVRLIRETRPRLVVAENVPGLAEGEALGYLRRVGNGIAELGYGVSVEVLNAADHGVPQARRRLFLVAVRGRRGLSLLWPRPLEYRYTLREALDVAGESPEEERDAVSFVGHALYPEWVKLGPGADCERYFSLVRPHPDAPCPTVTATSSIPSAASVAHPFDPRKFTPTELRAICGFPSDFRLVGTVRQQVERLGRAVPPLLAARVARWLAEEVHPLAR